MKKDPEIENVQAFSDANEDDFESAYGDHDEMVEELGEFGSQDWRTSSGSQFAVQIHPIHNFELKDRATERRAIPANDSGDENSDEDMSNNTNSKDNNFRGIASADQENLNLLGENQFLETSLLKCFNSFKIMQLGRFFKTFL